MWLAGYAYITLFFQKLGDLLKPSSLVKPHQQEFVGITSARAVELGGYPPPPFTQFLTFACGHFTRIIDFFTASHSSPPPNHISVPLPLNLCTMSTQGRFSIKFPFTYFTTYFNYTISYVVSVPYS